MGHLVGRSLRKIGSFGVLPCVGVGLELDFQCWPEKNYCSPWKENLVPPFVVVEIVCIDLLRELGFVMILWPANTFITVQPSTKCWSMG